MVSGKYVGTEYVVVWEVTAEESIGRIFLSGVVRSLLKNWVLFFSIFIFVLRS